MPALPETTMNVPYWIRIGLTVVLLVIVWKNSHWSVALSLTLLAVAEELRAVIKR